MPPTLNLPTADELRDRPAGLTVAQHIDQVREAITRHSAAAIQCAEDADAAKAKANRDSWLASDRRTWDRHDNEMHNLGVLLRRLENSDEGRRVDYRQVVDTGPVGGGGSQRDGRWYAGGEHIYGRNERTSWVRDMVAVGLRGDQEAADRLRRNNREVETEFRALNTGDGAGGEWVPPLWLIQQSVQLARAGRVFADQVNRQQLPAGTDSIKVPRMVTGTAVAEQTVQNTDVQETDATTDSVTADVATIGGQGTIPLQLIDQGPLAIDELILADLLADLAMKTDRFLISNNATNKVGVLNVAGLNAITYTDASPTMAELYPKIADAIQQIHTGRYLPPTKAFMHPRRWAWMTAQSDSTGRPLVVPVAQMPQNAVAAMGQVTSEGFVGSVQGLPAFVDPNLPTTLGAGTNEDRIVVARAEDILLWESIPRANAFRETKAAQLSVLLVVHNYLAVQAGRYPKSISVLSGTGLSAPTF